MKKYIETNDVSHAALIRAAREAVAGALAREFPVDPLIPPELSRALSCIGSVVKRHGKLIEMGITGALVMSNRFIVIPNVDLPLTKGAKQLLDAKNSDQTLSRIELAFDSEADGTVNLDAVVVDPEAGWAGAYEIKRGNGATDSAQRRDTLYKLKAARLVLASFVRKRLDCGPVERTTSAVIDYCGGSGFESQFALTKEQLDQHFEVPVVATVEAMTAAAREALQAELPGLFEPVFDWMTRSADPTPGIPNPGISTAGRFGPATGVTPFIGMSPPVGPGRRATSHLVRH